MSTQLRLVVIISALCLTASDFARFTSKLWYNRTELRGQLRLPLCTALSAVSIIVAALLLHYRRDDAVVTVLFVSFIAVAAIIQVIQLSACQVQPLVWLVGAVTICTFIEVQSVLLAKLDKEDLVSMIFLLVILQYSIMGLSYQTLYNERQRSMDQNIDNKGVKDINAHIIGNTTVCYITCLASSTSLGLDSYGFGRNDCLAITAAATQMRSLEPIWAGLRKLIAGTQNRSEIFPLSSQPSSVMESNTAFTHDHTLGV